jgi:hypothetical protein
LPVDAFAIHDDMREIHSPPLARIFIRALLEKQSVTQTIQRNFIARSGQHTGYKPARAGQINLK